MNYTIERILKESPVYQIGQMAFYSVKCCWWTSFADDLGKLPPVAWQPSPPDGSGIVKGVMVPKPGGLQLPCCPHCQSVLLEAPLADFIESAQRNPAHYGKYGLDIFLWSHERNSRICYRRWEGYEIFLAPFDDPAHGGR